MAGLPLSRKLAACPRRLAEALKQLQATKVRRACLGLAIGLIFDDLRSFYNYASRFVSGMDLHGIISYNIEASMASLPQAHCAGLLYDVDCKCRDETSMVVGHVGCIAPGCN